MKEKEIEAQILKFLWYLPGCICWKIDCTGIYDSKRGVYRQRKDKFARRKGVPDICGFYKGKFFALEIKTPKTKNRISPEQQEFIESARKNDQIAEVVHDIEQVRQIFMKDFK